MCLAVPACVVEINGDNAIVDLDGIRKDVSTLLLDEVAVGDYVLLHVGYALERINPQEAAETLAMFADMRADSEKDTT